MLISDVEIIFTVSKPTGKSEVTNLHDVDTAVINKIAEVTNQLTVTIPQDEDGKHPRLKPLKSLCKFLERDINKQIGSGSFESPRRFLLAFARAHNKATENGKTKNKIELPLMYVSREPSIMFSDTEKPQISLTELTSDNGQLLGNVDKYFVDLNYQINIVAWDKDEATMLALHVLTWLKEYDRSQSKTLTAKSNVSNAPCELSWHFKDAATVTADNASSPFSEGRLYAFSIPVMVTSEVLKVRYMESSDANLIGRSKYDD